MSLTRARPPTFQRRLRSVTLRQRLTRLLDMVGPQPPLVELLVRHVLLPREVLPQIERNSIERPHFVPSLWILGEGRLDVPEGGVARGHHVDHSRTA